MSAPGRRAVTQATLDQLTFSVIAPELGQDDCKPISCEDSSNNAVSGCIASETLAGKSEASESSGELDGLSDGYIPTASLSGSIVFGPELQNALFVDGEASADPKLPEPDGANGAASKGAEPRQVASVTIDAKVTAPTTPKRPPAGSPRLVNILMTGPPVHSYDGPANHNTMPSKPDTPLADQLRSDFWTWYHRDTQYFLLYKKSFREWMTFTKSDPSEAKPDRHSVAKRLKTAAIDAQVAWMEHHADFERWKAANPAVDFIIANAHQDTKALRAAEKHKAERDDFARNDLRGKSEKHQKQELARYDHFTRLMAQSREREMWRNRVEAQVKAEAMIEERNRIAAAAAAEEAKRKAAAEEHQGQEKGAEAEEQRKLVETQAVKKERLLREKPPSGAAHATEKEKAEGQARRESEAQRLAEESILLQMLGFPDTNRPKGLGNSMPQDWNRDHFAGVTTDTAIQQWAQEHRIGNETCGPTSSMDVPFETMGCGNTQTAQPDTCDVQDFQF